MIYRRIVEKQTLRFLFFNLNSQIVLLRIHESESANKVASEELMFFIPKSLFGNESKSIAEFDVVVYQKQVVTLSKYKSTCWV